MSSKCVAAAVLMFFILVFFSGSVFSMLSVAHVQNLDNILIDHMAIKENAQPEHSVPHDVLIDSPPDKINSTYAKKENS